MKKTQQEPNPEHPCDDLHRRSSLVEGRILRRYKRFLADVELADGTTVVAHCANTGTMASCWESGDRVLIEHNDNPLRKLRFTWIACCRGDHWVGIDTGVPNLVIAEAARRDVVPGIPGLCNVRTEVQYGNERSRIDVLAEDDTGRLVYIEVKNTTLRTRSEPGFIVSFPDAVTTRGLKHLRELRAMTAEGHRAAIIFFVHRDDVSGFRAARDIDPAYSDELDRATAAGVEVLPVQAQIAGRQGGSGRWTLRWSLAGLLPRV